MPIYWAWCPERCDESDALEIRADNAILAAEEYAQRKDDSAAEVTEEMRVHVKSVMGTRYVLDVFAHSQIVYSAKPAKVGA